MQRPWWPLWRRGRGRERNLLVLRFLCPVLVWPPALLHFDFNGQRVLIVNDIAALLRSRQHRQHVEGRATPSAPATTTTLRPPTRPSTALACTQAARITPVTAPSALPTRSAAVSTPVSVYCP